MVVVVDVVVDVVVVLVVVVAAIVVVVVVVAPAVVDGMATVAVEPLQATLVSPATPIARAATRRRAT